MNIGYVREAGKIRLMDGTEVKGIIVEFPDGPPPEVALDALIDMTPVAIVKTEAPTPEKSDA